MPRARMGSESIQLVGQKYQDKTTLASKTRFSRHCFGFQSRLFSLQVGYNIYLFNLIQYLSWGIQFSSASLNGALTKHKNKDIKILKLDN